MENIHLETIYKISDDIVAREIEDELIIVPLVAGIGDLEDELFTLNDTGKAIWKQFDGKNSLREIVTNLSQEYAADHDEMINDVLGLVGELARRRMVIAVVDD
ncbi:MAG: PqqD family protein [Desulfotignum sp.]|nr:PqqD family protein [Desulfotignum sp.]